jgi:hypothetical protein
VVWVSGALIDNTATCRKVLIVTRCIRETTNGVKKWQK